MNKIKSIILIIFIFLSTSLFAQVESITKIVFNDDFTFVVDDGFNFKISNAGVVTYKAFKQALFDTEEVPWYEAGKYRGLVYRDYLVADMSMEGEYGGMRFTLFANHYTNNVIFLRDITDKPAGLRTAVGYDKYLVFIYSKEAVCYDLETETVLWTEIWYSEDQKLTSVYKKHEVLTDSILISLRNNKKIILDYSKGTK